MSLCPCGSGGTYVACCAPLHGGAAAGTAEALMRSRYAAFALRLPDYLLASWHSSTRPAALMLEADMKWLGLSVKAHRNTGVDTAIVEFIARSRCGGAPAQRLHEHSRFVRENGRWFYLDALPTKAK